MLGFKPEGGDLSSLFMDQGYLFFSINLKKEVKEHWVDLTFEIFEGNVFKIGKIFLTGNKNIPTEEILKMVDINEGEVFSRIRLFFSHKKIVESGLPATEELQIQPHPHPEEGKVDLEYILSEL